MWHRLNLSGTKMTISSLCDCPFRQHAFVNPHGHGHHCLSMHACSDPAVSITPAINGSAFPRTMLIPSNGSDFSRLTHIKAKPFAPDLKTRLLLIFITTLLWLISNFAFHTILFFTNHAGPYPVTVICTLQFLPFKIKIVNFAKTFFIFFVWISVKVYFSI